VDYELAVVISYPTLGSGIFVLFKNAPKYRKLKLKKNAQKTTRALTMFVEHSIMAHFTMIAKPMETLELRYPMIQFSIN